ncbi:hypothetical protein [Halocalculus aciditolerans]|uniref:Uncharacterized protein n=1 Tax=Halocalculus aciditolerans TaxID=1383812 RepID=A0A830F296_9EURY|nr:hypothetical protein [Halocalculus aciditolerans]GGL55378.1 hypothetical protein GCM10009039_11880 [Halocalculus aciditolerans]
MHAALLHILHGDPDVTELPNRLGNGLPGATAGQTRYLDGRTINYGVLAGEITDEKDVPVVGSEDIHTERDEVTRRVKASYHADLEAGWAGADSSDGTRLLADYLISSAGVIPKDSEIRLDEFVGDLTESARVNGVVYSQPMDDGYPEDAAGSAWHDAVDTDDIPAEGVSALAVTYNWDGLLVDAMLAKSGYVAVYSDAWATEAFARWVAEEVEPYLQYATDDQQTLGGGE